MSKSITFEEFMHECEHNLFPLVKIGRIPAKIALAKVKLMTESLEKANIRVVRELDAKRLIKLNYKKQQRIK